MNPTVEEIRNLGFEWPKNILIEQYCYMDGLRVDLFRTLGKLMKARSEIYDLWVQFKREANTEQECEINLQAEKHDEVISYLRKIQAAFEKKGMGPEDLLRPIWHHLGISGVIEVRPLTRAEACQLLESNAVLCAWTEWTYTHLHWISRQEVEQQILPHLVDSGPEFPFYAYMASEWRGGRGCVDETILLFCMYYVNL